MTRLLILSDIHGNMPALEKILESIEKYDDVIVLGDLVDYGPHPGEVIDLLKSIGAKIVRGNHDHAAAYKVDCKCGEATHWLSVWFRENITLELLSREDRSFLASLPFKLKLKIDNTSGLAVHAAPRNPLYSYFYPWLGEAEACRLLSRPSLRISRSNRSCSMERLVIIGHTHYQFVRTIRGNLIVNPGSVGQPRDGDWRAGYAIIDTSNGSVSVGRVKYNVERTIKSLKDLKTPQPYLNALIYMLMNATTPKPPHRG